MKDINTLNGQVDTLFFIGDVHGQNNKLELLLAEADFDIGDIENSSYRSSRLVFLGDLIDNKPDQGADHISTLDHVKSLVEQGLAYCVMGNHEFNAIGWSIQKQDGSYCRCHDKPGNIKQHQLFLEQVGENSDEHIKWVQWFKTLPLFLDFDTVRCIHACWDQDAIDRLKTYLNPDNSLKEEYWLYAFNPEHELYSLCEMLLKGPELALPDGHFFYDKNGVQRQELRMAWWKSDAVTYRDIGIVQQSERERIPDIPLPKQQQAKVINVPVIVGHYTLHSTPECQPFPLSAQVVCVDYNAASKEGKLVGYWMELYSSDTDEVARVTERQFCYQDAPMIESYIDEGVCEL